VADVLARAELPSNKVLEVSAILGGDMMVRAGLHGGSIVLMSAAAFRDFLTTLNGAYARFIREGARG